VSSSERTDLLVIGAGPYAYSAAAHARARGIRTRIHGRPLSFWRDHMPTDMYLRSGPDWHLDADGEHTFAAYFEDRGLDPTEHDPVPIGVWLDHADWFADQKKLDVDERLVDTLTHTDAGFEARLDDGTGVTAERVLAAPGIRHFAHLPVWAFQVPEHQRSHTVDLVDFDALGGSRVVVVGGRQSAYEWAALLADHGAESVDVVHRHPTPRFERVSWAFLDPYVDQTVAVRGWWRRLPEEEQQRIAARFWQVGRLTLEPWLVPRLPASVVTSRPRTEVVGVHASPAQVGLVLSDGSRLEADHVVFASGYAANLARVPYLAGLVDRIGLSSGFPELSEGFETSLAGLYVTGFAATRDFGPFYGFTKGCPSAARVVVEEILR
jgi:thioredoxin reductase